MPDFQGNYGKGDILEITKEHVALLLLVDTSGSMYGSKIKQVNDGINNMIRELANDENAQNVVEISVVEFNSDVNVVSDFKAACQCQPVTLNATGGTNMGEGILTAIDNLKARVRTYGTKGTPVRKPWIFMLTDGYPNSICRLDEAKTKLNEEMQKRDGKGDFLFWCIGTPDADFDLLKELATPGCCGKIDDSSLYTLFDWIAKSMITISSAKATDTQATVSQPPFMQIPI
ncbi:MAG: VWA domain-containing protein [Ruminococcus sp.]|nr:VWA domain-containing protein [Ruminococcus sp.]